MIRSFGHGAITPRPLRVLATAMLLMPFVLLTGSARSADAAQDPRCPACVNALLPAITIPTARGAASAIPLEDGPAGAYLLVHQGGDVSLMAADGSHLWNRPVTTLEQDWGLQLKVSTPDVRTGYDAFDPFAQVSSRVHALGRLAGSSSSYLAVAHEVRPTATRRVTFVALLDATTGETAWFRQYPGVVTQLLIRDGVLVVGHETGAPATAPRSGFGEQDTHSVLAGLTFSAGADGQLVAHEGWSYSTETEWARWLVVEPLDGGAVAAAWSGTKPGTGGSGDSKLLLLDAATGSQRWAIDTASYTRLLRYDPTRNELVVVGQADPTVGWSYTVEARHESDGSLAGPVITREAAVPFALEIGDVDSRPGAEWVTSDLAMSSAAPGSDPDPAGAAVTATDGDGSTLWKARANETTPVTGAGRPPIVPYPYGLVLREIGGATVVLAATYFPGTEPLPLRRPYSGQSELRALAGTTGSGLWSRSGNVLTPLALAPYAVDGRPALLTATAALVVNAYSLADGSTLRSTPLLADVTAVEATDVNSDGVTDLVVGGQSEAVLALDGRTLGVDPSILWVTPVEGEVHEIHAVSLPDGRKSLVVVAATASVVDGNQSYPIPTKSGIEVLAADTGERRFRLPTLPDYAWTAVVATLDGVPAIVVPTRYLTAYRASDGAQLWRFSPVPVEVPPPPLAPVYFSNPAIANGGGVAVQYFVNVGVDAGGQRIRPTSGNSNNHVRVLLDGATGLPRWQVPIAAPGVVNLRRAVVTGVPTATGAPGAAFTFQAGQHPAYTTKVDVHDLRDGSLSYGALLSRGSHMGTLALPVNGLVTFNRFSEIASISPDGAVERRLGWPASHDVAEARTGTFGDVLVTASEGHGFFGIWNATPGPTGYTRVADWVCGATGGSLLIRDLDGDGSDEVVHYSHDNAAHMAVTNQYGLFSIGGDGGCGNSGVDIYRLGTNTPPTARLTATPIEGQAPLSVAFDGAGSSDPDAGDSIASFRFDFGDGSEPVTQETPMVSHTYAQPGTYRASLTVTDSRGVVSEAAAVAIRVLAAPTCFEDDAPQLAYEPGWHGVNDADASAGHFRLSHGKGMSFAFETQAEQGTLQYVFATSSKGGSADLYVDGQLVRTVSYRGETGSLRNPVLGAEIELPLAGAGSHTFELRNASGPTYLDTLCLSEGSSQAQPGAGPGPTNTGTGAADGGGQLARQLTLPIGTLALAVLAETDSPLPYTIAVLDPAGNLLATTHSSPDGTASLHAPITTPGTYLLQLLNPNLTPITIWTATTPQVTR